MAYKKNFILFSCFALIHTTANLAGTQRLSRLEQIITIHDLTTKNPQDVCKILNGYQETERLKKQTGTIITIGKNQYTKNNYGDWTLYDANLESMIIQPKDTKPVISENHKEIFEQIKIYIAENPTAHVLTLLNLNLPAPDKTEITINGATYKKACHGKWYQPDAKVYSLHPNSMPEVQSAKSLDLAKKGPVLSKKRTSQLAKLIATHNLADATIQDTLCALNDPATKLKAPNFTKIEITGKRKRVYCKSFKGPWVNMNHHLEK